MFVEEFEQEKQKVALYRQAETKASEEARGE
jgi:hypothetical protein